MAFVRHRTKTKRMAAVVAVTALAVGLGACGGSDEDAGEPDASADVAKTTGSGATSKDSGTAPATVKVSPRAEVLDTAEKQKVYAAFMRMQRALGASDAAGACAAGSSTATSLMSALGGSKDCKRGFQTYAKQNGKIEPYSPKVEEVKINGDAGSLRTIDHAQEQWTLLTKENGKWKVDTWARSKPGSFGAQPKQ